jgi:CDP-diacylglycerol--glycerol-3-phosphate 3-phosphatidyltransferase/cardiolipin synthase
MTFATKLTVLRLVLVPVFAFLAISYGLGTVAGAPDEALRRAAFWVFVTAAATDGIDGWIARHFNQKSELGAFLDPIADKALVLSALLILTFFDWGVEGWRIPLWFAALVVLRDSVILAGIRVMWSARKNVVIRPHWTGKVCTFFLFVVLGWVMLRVTELSPVYPCAFAAVFILLSMLEYIRQGLRIMRGSGVGGQESEKGGN